MAPFGFLEETEVCPGVPELGTQTVSDAHAVRIQRDKCPDLDDCIGGGKADARSRFLCRERAGGKQCHEAMARMMASRSCQGP